MFLFTHLFFFPDSSHFSLGVHQRPRQKGQISSRRSCLSRCPRQLQLWRLLLFVPWLLQLSSTVVDVKNSKKADQALPTRRRLGTTIPSRCCIVWRQRVSVRRQLNLTRQVQLLMLCLFLNVSQKVDLSVKPC